jgi:GGDEF domain-containing protein
MEYRRFELLVIGAAAVLVGGGFVASWPSGGASPTEIGAQLAILLVVAVAAHWGRKAGTLVALAASVTYLALRIPLIAGTSGGPAVLLVVSRIAGYLLLGIVGGEIFGRIKYVFAGRNNVGAIDEFSHVFSERFASHAVRQALARADRLGEPFGLVLITLDSRFSEDAGTEHRRTLVRSVANVIRDDVRVIDDVAHLHDGRFAVILPHTHLQSAQVVAARLAGAIGSAHGVQEQRVLTQCLATPDDQGALVAFCERLEEANDPARDYAPSGA